MGRRTRQRLPDRVGRDLARVGVGARRRRSRLPMLLAGCLVAGLALASLRIEILRLGYALAESLEQEQALLEERRVWKARVEALKHPPRLARLARERGLARATRVIELPPAGPAGDRP